MAWLQWPGRSRVRHKTPMPGHLTTGLINAIAYQIVEDAKREWLLGVAQLNQRPEVRGRGRLVAAQWLIKNHPDYAHELSRITDGHLNVYLMVS